MVNTLKSALGVLTIFLCIGMAQDVTLTFNPDGSVDYSSSQDISGFQFDHTGCAAGAVSETSFSVSGSASTVIGFDFSGATLPAGDGALISGVSCSASDISNIIISGPVGDSGQADQLSAIAVDGEEEEVACEDVGGMGFTCDEILAFGGACGGTFGSLDVDAAYPATCGLCASGPGEELVCPGEADVCIGVDSDGNVNLVSSDDVYGFQMNHTGCEGSAVAGADSDGAGFSTTINSGIFFAFSFSAGSIPAGEMTIISGTDCTVDDLSNIVISGQGGASYSVETGVYQEAAEPVLTCSGSEPVCIGVDSDGNVNYSASEPIYGYQFKAL